MSKHKFTKKDDKAIKDALAEKYRRVRVRYIGTGRIDHLGLPVFELLPDGTFEEHEGGKDWLKTGDELILRACDLTRPQSATLFELVDKVPAPAQVPEPTPEEQEG